MKISTLKGRILKDLREVDSEIRLYRVNKQHRCRYCQQYIPIYSLYINTIGNRYHYHYNCYAIALKHFIRVYRKYKNCVDAINTTSNLKPI